MPTKYHIHTQPAPPRFTPVGQFGIVDFGEDCARVCLNCVKRSCVYELYKKDTEFRRTITQPVEFSYECKNCLRCVEGCTKAALVRIVNPEYKWLGDEFYTPEIINKTWYQAESGKIPVSGAGYRGPFSGPGFDGMWTDMSEIVRPTRDGIHGREYISTSVEIGRKLSCLEFKDDGTLARVPPSNIEIPIPLILDTPPFGDFSDAVFEAFIHAAAELGAFAVVPARFMPDKSSRLRQFAVPILDLETIKSDPDLVQGTRMVEVNYGPGVMNLLDTVKAGDPGRIMIVRIPLGPDSADIVSEFTGSGAEAVHLAAGIHGQAPLPDGSPGHLKDALRLIHGKLVDAGIRDQVTIIASGGIALAEHLAKAIICGADLVAMDIPAQIAMECRLCGDCTQGLPCPVKLSEIDPNLGAQRIVNLAAAWHNQLLEVMGAMGMREVRRLRAELGRAMFFEDLERDSFGKLFGKRKS